MQKKQKPNVQSSLQQKMGMWNLTQKENLNEDLEQNLELKNS